MNAQKPLLRAHAALTYLALAAILTTGCGDETPPERRAAQPKTTAAKPGFVGAIDLERTNKRSIAYGRATIARRGNEYSIIVQATLKPNRPGETYEVWLYNTRTDARSLGAERTDANGEYEGAAELPADYARYRYIDVSAEGVNDDAEHSEQSVLRGDLQPTK